MVTKFPVLVHFQAFVAFDSKWGKEPPFFDILFRNRLFYQNMVYKKDLLAASTMTMTAKKKGHFLWTHTS